MHISSVGKEPVLLYLTDVLAFPVFFGPFYVQKSLNKFNSVATMLKKSGLYPFGGMPKPH